MEFHCHPESCRTGYQKAGNIVHRPGTCGLHEEQSAAVRAESPARRAFLRERPVQYDKISAVHQSRQSQQSSDRPGIAVHRGRCGVTAPLREVSAKPDEFGGRDGIHE